MKRIKSFKMFESSRALSAIAGECEDILAPLRDAGLETRLDWSDRYRRDEIAIGISAKPGEPALIRIDGFEAELEHLFSYLEEEGFSLSYESSYEGLDSREACPECGHDEIRNLGFDDSYSFMTYECIHCGHESDADNFSTCYWPISPDKGMADAMGKRIYGAELVFADARKLESFSEGPQEKAQDIRDCFRELEDIGVSVKISMQRPELVPFGRFTSLDSPCLVSISLDGRPMQKAVSEYGQEYMMADRAEEIAALVSESIGKCESYGLVPERAEIKWMNAGEWRASREAAANMKIDRIVANSKLDRKEVEDDLKLVFSPKGEGPGMLERIFDKGSRYTVADAAKDPAKAVKLNISEIEAELLRTGPRFRQIKAWFSLR